MTRSLERNCAQCGYDLAGLKGLRGTCPECGAYWDAMSGKGLADRAHERQRQERFLNRLRTWALAAFTLLVLACGGTLSFAASDPVRPLAIAGLIAALGAMATATSYLSERDET